MTSSKTTIIGIRTSFVGMHFWKDAPETEAFLRNPHRHVFNVTVELTLRNADNLDRELEYFAIRKQLDARISLRWGRWANGAFPDSCEMIASVLADELLAQYIKSCYRVAVTVQEDGENFSRVELQG